MKNTVKRLLACLVVLMMVLPICVSAFAMEHEQYSGSLEAKAATTYDTTGIRNGKTFEAANVDLVAEEIAPNQIVPIMVELEDAPAMEVYGDYKSAENYTARLLEKQQVAVKNIKSALDVDVDVIYNYTLLFNGFSFNGEYRLVEELNKIPGIRAFVAMEWDCPDIQLYNSSNMVGAISAWELNYTGEGAIVAIIDTGLMCNHEAFSVLPDADTMHFNQDDVAAIIAEGQLQGSGSANMNADLVYYGDKVPFRWNYVRNNHQVGHVYNDHGTHVAGIAAGNGGEIQGIAKDAQIAAMQVFQDSGGAGWVHILAALEDCVVLGVDSANLSLGSANGTTQYYDPSYAVVFENLVNAGVNLAMAAGNDSSSTYNNAWSGYALVQNPDYGVVGSPSTWPESLSIASVNNSMSEGFYIEHEGVRYSYTENAENAVMLAALFGGQTLPIVAVPGFGTVEDFAQIDAVGKVALVQRGEINFVDKGLNAQAAGAIACIVYNNTAGNINMVSDPGITIPFVFVSQVAGETMVNSESAEIYVSSETALVPMPGGGEPSDFSSWGTTTDLHIKPEIAAPGGNIYSATSPSFSGTYYQAWNGTSMACPHVAGGMAIVTEFVEDMFPSLTTAEKQNMVDTILMSTANPVNDAGGNFASVRKQGAGLMDLEGAVNTTAYLSVEGSVRPKLELGDDPEKTGEYELRFTVTNFGENEVMYAVVPYVFIDTAVGLAYAPDSSLVVGTNQQSEDITADCTLEYTELITVPAGESLEVVVNVKLNDDLKGYLDAYYTSGAFVEGFVELYVANGMVGDLNGDDELTSADALLIMRYAMSIGETLNPTLADVNRDGLINMEDALLIFRVTLGVTPDVTFGVLEGVDLSIPYLAYYGDWNTPPMLDIGYYYEDFNLSSHPYPNTVGSTSGSNLFGLGINPYVDTADMSYYLADRNALSPNEDNFMDAANTLYAGLMRNASEVSYRLYNAETGALISTLASEQNAWKGFYYDNISTFRQMGVHHMIMPTWNAAPYANTNIEIRVEAILNNDGSVSTNPYSAEANANPVWSIPIFVDVTAPTATAAVVDGKLAVTVNDDHYVAYVGAWNAEISNGIVVLSDLIDEAGVFETTRNATTVVELDATGSCYVAIADYAGNEVLYQWDGTTLTLVSNAWSPYTGSGFSIPNVEFYCYGKNLNTLNWCHAPIDGIGTATGVYFAGGLTSDSNNYNAGCYTGTYVYGVTATNQLYRYNATDINDWGAIENLGNLGTLPYVINEMAYNRVTNKLYIVIGAGSLYEINLSTITATRVCDIDYGCVAIDFDVDGTCYVVDIYGCLDTLDITTGITTEIADLGVNAVNTSTGNFFIQSGCVRNGYFYYASLPADATTYSQGSLIVVKCDTGASESLGAVIGGLYCIGTFVWEFEAPPASVDHSDFYENFEGDVNWMTADADGDGNNWVLEYQGPGLYHDGSRTIVSYSWDEVVLTPDNWIVSPAFTVANDGNEKFISFWTASRNSSPGADIDEHYAVYVGPANATNTGEFTMVYEHTMETAALTEHVVNISEYAGQDIRIAFRHFDCTDEYTLIIDAVAVGNWIGQGEAPNANIGTPSDVNISFGNAVIEAVLPNGKSVYGVEE